MAFVENVEKLGEKLNKYFVEPLKEFANEAVSLYSKQREAENQVKAGLESMGKSFGLTFDELKEKSENLSKSSNLATETILRNVTAQFMRFNNITAENFNRAQEITLEVSGRLDSSFGNLQTIAQALGKTLNNPADGLMRLHNLGVTFEKDQEKQIKGMFELGQVEKAQTIILDILHDKYKGTLEAMKEAQTGAKSSALAWEDLYKVIGEHLLPIYKKLNAAKKEVADWIREHLNPTLTKSIVIFGGVAFAIISATVALFSFVTGIMVFQKLWGAVSAAFLATNVTALATLGTFSLWIIGITASLAILFLAFNDIYTWSKGGDSLIGRLLGPWEKFSKGIKEAFGDLWKNLKDFGKNFLLLFNPATREAAVRKMTKDIMLIIADTILIMKPIIEAAIQVIVDSIASIIKNSLKNIIKDALHDFLGINVSSDFMEKITKWIPKAINVTAEIAKAGALSMPMMTPYINPQNSINNIFGSGKSENSTINQNVSIPVTVTVPAGTSEMQQKFIQETTEKTMSDVFDRKFTDITRGIYQKPGMVQ
jgi:hypothetical protein